MCARAPSQGPRAADAPAEPRGRAAPALLTVWPRGCHEGLGAGRAAPAAVGRAATRPWAATLALCAFAGVPRSGVRSATVSSVTARRRPCARAADARAAAAADDGIGGGGVGAPRVPSGGAAVGLLQAQGAPRGPRGRLGCQSVYPMVALQSALLSRAAAGRVGALRASAEFAVHRARAAAAGVGVGYRVHCEARFERCGLSRREAAAEVYRTDVDPVVAQPAAGPRSAGAPAG